MPNQSGKVVLVLVLFLLLIGTVYFLLPGFKKQENTEQITNPSIQPSRNPEQLEESSALFRKYSSKDLKIFFKYPSKWFIEEKYYFIMMTSYATKFSSNQQPTQEQIEVDIHNYNGGCHKTIDENLKDPACGEGGPKVKPNEIVSKETEDINGAKFHKYLIKYPDGKEAKFYFLEKGEKVLQIDKTPDPSIFEKEFMGIIRSIRFLKSD